MKSKILISAALAACLTSCAAPEVPKENRITQERVEGFIVKGKTTKEQVIAEFGPPSTTTITSMSIPTTHPEAIPYETMGYSKIYSRFPVQVVVLMVQLDRRGTVIGYIFSGQ